MTTQEQAPGREQVPLLRRFIGRELFKLREPTGYSREAAGREVELSRATMDRLEEGHPGVRLRNVDISNLLDLYKAPDDIRALILGAAEEARASNGSKSWWHNRTAGSGIPAFFSMYVMFEESADRILPYCMETVPGLLQTRQYADAVHRVPVGYVSEAEIDKRVQVRMERQSLLTRPRAPRLEVILNEAVLHRTVGTPEIMAEQLAHLIKVSEWGNVSIRILPFSAGLHGGMAASTPFIILEFPRSRSGEPLEPDLAYVDSLTGALYLQKPDEVEAYRQCRVDLEERALDENLSREMIANRMKGLRHG